jgi:hypothetical protein
MKKTKPKTLQDKINEATHGIKCPVHMKEPKIKLNSEQATAEIDCCCNSFKMDVNTIVERVLRAWNLHGEHLRARKNNNY